MFWHQAYYFEKHEDGYVYRSTIFSRGYSVSEPEKDLLYRNLKRLEQRFLIKGGVVVVVTAGLFMTGLIETEMPIFWFMVCSILGVIGLAFGAVYFRHWLVKRILGNRSPDAPRSALGPSPVTLRLPFNKHYTIRILQSVAVLFGLTLASIISPKVMDPKTV